MRSIQAILIFILVTPAFAQPSTEVVCSYAPSQSNAVAATSAVSGAGATSSAMVAATGLTAVAHSSGALILTGTSGYIAGTLGAPAVAVATAPVIVTVGLVVGGAAVTLELVCAAKNYPDQVAKVNEAAAEFSRRFGESMQRTQIAVGDMKKSVMPVADRTAIGVKQVATDVWRYAYRKSVELSDTLLKYD